MDDKPKPVGRSQKVLEIVKSRVGGIAETSAERPLSEGHQPIQSTLPGVFSSEKPSSGRARGRGVKLFQAVNPEKPGVGTAVINVAETSKSSTLGTGRGLFLSQLRMQSKSKVEAVSDVDVSKSSRKSLVFASEESSVQKEIEKLQIESEKSLPTKKGEAGEKVEIYTNFITLTVDSGKGIFEYEVRFEPEITFVSFRYQLINQHFQSKKGMRCYDGGDKLYMPEKVIENKIAVEGRHPSDDSKVIISITFKKQLQPKDCTQLYNILFHNCSKVLNLARLGRQHYDFRIGHKIPQHKLEIWPGYVTSVEEFEGGIHLCCDIRHRVLRTETAYDILGDITRLESKEIRTKMTKEFIGQCVLTRYNNNLYRIDDIDWERTPMSTFKLSSGEEITFINYYKKQYNLDIKDSKQPLLINRPKRNKKGERPSLICLIPELCHMTGLTDTIRRDMRVMKEISTYTRISPSQRQYGLKKFIENIRSNPRAQEMLNDWGLKIAPEPLLMSARVLPKECIFFKNKQKVSSPPNLEWSKYIRNHGVLRSIDIIDWVLIFTNRDSNIAQLFKTMLQTVARGLGFHIDEAVQVCLTDDRIDTYITGIKAHITGKTQIVVCLCPTARDDRYSAIKKLLCREIPIPSQIVNCNSIKRESRMRPVVQNIALQMNNKLGGATWALHIPLKNTMVCGIDSYHDANKMNSSVGAFVASLDDQFTKWFSQTCIQDPKQELVDGLIHCFISGLKKYYCVNNAFPERIIIFRDGVSDGQLHVVQNHEVKQFLLTCNMFEKKYNPRFSFIVVQKRINTKYYQVSNLPIGVENPRPGCVVDHNITRRNYYDFFLVSQHVTCGTATPSHYIVLHDNSDMKPDIMQRLTYKFCHIYYNWPGTIRVPAPCQYAHKLAYLVGQNIKGLPDIALEDKLFYL